MNQVVLPCLNSGNRLFLMDVFTKMSGMYTERVLEAVHLLGNEVMPNFASKAEAAVDALRGVGDPEQIDENEFIAASTLVYEGVKDSFVKSNISLMDDHLLKHFILRFVKFVELFC